jgi:hypothetical protein
VSSLFKLAPRALRMLARSSAGGAAPPAPPRNRFERSLAFTSHWGLNLSVVLSALLLAGLLDASSSADWLNWTRLALGLAMLLEGALLAADWRGARRLTLWRLRERRKAPGTARSLRSRLLGRLADPGLQLLGLVWLAAGLLTAALAGQQLA